MVTPSSPSPRMPMSPSSVSSPPPTPPRSRPPPLQLRLRRPRNQTVQAHHATIFSQAPTVVDVTLKRPAAVPEITEAAQALFGSYNGSSDETFLDVVFGDARPLGRLAFDMPSVMEYVVLRAMPLQSRLRSTRIRKRSTIRPLFPASITSEL